MDKPKKVTIMHRTIEYGGKCNKKKLLTFIVQSIFFSQVRNAVLGGGDIAQTLISHNKYAQKR